MKNSLEYYRQAAADSDDSDCDLLIQKPIFQSRKKPKQNETNSPSSIVSLSQSSLESNTSIMMTKEQIEVKAKEMIKDLNYPGLGDTNRMDHLGWHKHPRRKGSKEFTWYPCRLASHDEKIGLVPKSSKKEFFVRYLGYQSDTAPLCGTIKSREFIRLTAENKESGMDTYIRHLEKHFKDDAVACRAEVLAVLEMWRKVEERESVSISKTKSPIKEATKATSRIEPSVARNTSVNKTPSDGGASSDEGNSDSDLDLEDTGEHSTASRKIPLRAGDVIEYYDPIGVAGKSQWLKRALVVGIQARDKFPLNLDNGDFLERTVRVKRVKRLCRQKLEICHDAAFKDMFEYGLKSGGTMELIGVKTKVERAKRIRKTCNSQVQDFWKDVSPEEVDNSVTNSNDPCLSSKDHATGPDNCAVDGISVTNEKNRQLGRPLALRNQNTYEEESKRNPPRIQGPP